MNITKLIRYKPQRIFCISLLNTLSIISVISQVYTADYWILDSTITGTKVYEAYDSILMVDGFSYTASGGSTFEARIIPPDEIIPEVIYLPAPDYDRELNTSLPVGTLPGSFNISATGAMNYSIPIEIPPGRRGLAPDIAITYNSQSGIKFLGRGWDLSGLSCITRVNRDIYHDGQAGAINFDQDDKFALDGNRLIAVNGLYGEDDTEYRTEFEDFSRIISYGTAGSGPSYFIIETKEGLTMEYGNTDHSKIEASGKTDVLFWYLNKIEDNYGNYLEFVYYENNSTGEVRPVEINYTGNQTLGFPPMNSIRFSYVQKSDKNTWYIAGSQLQDNVLLHKIEVIHENAKIREYEFNYSYNNESQLTEVILYGENGTPYNSGIIEWGEYSDNCSSDWAPSLSMDHTGDFNGDGYKDFIKISGNSAYFYLNTGSGNNFVPADTIDVTGYQDIYVGDMNGDLSEDIILKKYQYPGYYFVPYLSNGTQFTAHTDSFMCSTYTHTFHLADFTGDGKCEGILRYGNYYDVITFTNIPDFDFSVDNYYLEAYEDEISVAKSPEAIVLDINGDNKANIMFLGEIKKAHFYELTDNGLAHLFTQSVYSRSYYKFGDFNGDGKTDFAFPAPELEFGPNNAWGISYSTGNDLETVYITIGDLSTTTNLIYSGDVDGDGKTDLVFIGYGEQEGTELGMYVAYSRVDSFEVKSYQTYVSSVEAQIGDFNGNGLMEVYNSHYFHSFLPDRNHCLVQSITNGFNQKTSFSYNPLTDEDIYEKGSDSEYPVADFQGPLYVLSFVKAGNGTGGITENTFSYSGALMHQQGRGLLGFTKMHSTNSSTGLETVKTFGYHPDYFFPGINKIEVIHDNDTAYIESYTNSVITNGNGRIFPYLSEVEKNYKLEDIVNTTTYEYDTCGNVLRIITDYQGEATDTITNSYIAKGSWCPSKLTLSTTKKKRTGEDAYVLSVATTYNDYGQPDTFINDTDSPDPLITLYDYDNPFGLLTEIIRSAAGETDRQEIVEYDSTGIFIIRKTNALGQHMDMTYNKAYGNVLSSADINGFVTEYQYDEFGRLTQTRLPDGNTLNRTISWRESGDPAHVLFYVLEERDGLPAQRTLLDSLGREVRDEKTGFDGTAILTDVIYNADGRVWKVSDPYYSTDQPVWTEYSYDTFGRKTGESSPLANISTSYNGRTVTTTNTSATPNRSVTRTIDPAGQLSSITDAGGSISYTYYSSGLPKTVTSPGGAVTSLEFDKLGNRTRINEPNAGTYTFEYNPFGEMVLQNANDSITELTYDELGRVLTLDEPEGTTTFTYDTKNKGLGKLSGISSPGGVTMDFEYDTLGRLAAKTESIDSLDFTESFLYDRYGRDSVLIYPSGFTIKYIYNNNSYLSQIKRTSDNSLIWQANSMNSRDQITASAYGNSLVSQFSYDHGHVTGIQTGNIQHLQYEWDFTTGNLQWRKDAIRDMTETFTYDNLDRLTEISFGSITQRYDYQPNGNISAGTPAGSYTYGQDKPHAVTMVTNPSAVADTTAQELEYTSFNKVKRIIQGAKELDIYYGANRQRIKTEYQDTTHQLTRYFAHGNYEREIGDKNRELHYIFAGTGIAAIMQRGSSVDSMFYVHPDHLGSLVLITDENGDVYEEKSFDAFGRIRDPEDWSMIVTDASYRFDRGFTGHEHLEQFGLINMNGRMFDPHTARFLSPDLFVQDPAFTQSFNRYSYCLNNPLRFVDPGGYEYKDIMPPHWPRRGQYTQKRHQDGGSGGYSYDSSSPTGYRNASGDVVSWGEVYNNYVLPNSTAVDPGLFYDVLLDAQSGNLRIINMYGQDWFVYVNPSSGKLTSYMSLTVSKLNSYYNISYCENNDIGGGSWSISLNIAWGGGFNLELGRVWDNKGGTHRFLTIGPSIGVDISIGILQKNIYNPNFSVNQYQGYCSSIDIGISVLDWVIIGGDNYEETWYSKFGYNYGEEGWGISLGLPLGAVWNMGKTWTF